MAADPGPAQGVGRNYVVWIARQDTLEARESDHPSALVDLGRFRLVQSVQADGQLTILPPIATLPLPPRATEEGMIPVCLFVLADMSKFQSLYEAFRAVALAPTWAAEWPLSTGLRHVALQRFLGLPCAHAPSGAESPLKNVVRLAKDTNEAFELNFTFSAEQLHALDRMDNEVNMLLGAAGTGKSELLLSIVTGYLADPMDDVVIFWVAPTREMAQAAYTFIKQTHGG